MFNRLVIVSRQNIHKSFKFLFVFLIFLKMLFFSNYLFKYCMFFFFFVVYNVFIMIIIKIKFLKDFCLFFFFVGNFLFILLNFKWFVTHNFFKKNILFCCCLFFHIKRESAICKYSKNIYIFYKYFLYLYLFLLNTLLSKFVILN